METCVGRPTSPALRLRHRTMSRADGAAKNGFYDALALLTHYDPHHNSVASACIHRLEHILLVLMDQVVVLMDQVQPGFGSSEGLCVSARICTKNVTEPNLPIRLKKDRKYKGI